MAMAAARVAVDPDELLKLAVWEKGRIIGGFPPEQWRWDAYGYVIRYADYGKSSSRYGWYIDRFQDAIPTGGDPLAELRPLNCCTRAGARLPR